MQTRPKCFFAGSTVPAVSRAFSVVELMVSIALMSVIVIALYAVFNQTQKALRASVAQVDMSGTGRAVLDLVARDLQSLSALAPSEITNIPNLQVRFQPATPAMPAPPVIQEDLDGTPLRTNVLQQVFFLTRENREWSANAYNVLNATNGLGTLTRFSRAVHVSDLTKSGSNLVTLFDNAMVRYYSQNNSLDFHPVADGVIHFRLLAYDALGHPWTFGAYPRSYPTNYTETYLAGGTLEKIWLHSDPNRYTNNVMLAQEKRAAKKGEIVAETSYMFTSNALPAYVDLELGVIEPEALKQYNALRDSPGDTAYNFLRKQAAKVQIFRKRIPIRIATQ
jgi:hypothetical protein